jgi:hypothetical protein
MTFQPGQSGNLAGRPRKSKALTEILEQAGNRTLVVGDRNIARKRFTAEKLWELATVGQVTLPNGVVLVATLKDISETLRWLYGHIDPPAQRHEVTGKDGNALELTIVEHIVTRNPIASDPEGVL